MNIYFYPKKSKRGSSTIYVKVIIDDITTEISTGLKVNPETWDKDNDIMEYLHNTRKKIIQIHNSLVSENAVITSQRIKDAYVTRYVESHTLMGELKSMIERIKIEVQIGNRSKASVQKHQVFLRHVIGFLTTKHLTDVTFDQVTVAFLQELETFIKNSGCAHNTTKKHLDIMRKLYRYAKANNWTDQDPFYFYKISERPVKKEPLDEHEMRVFFSASSSRVLVRSVTFSSSSVSQE